MKLSTITCTVTGTIGGYTVTKETTMKQIDIAQLDTAACQARCRIPRPWLYCSPPCLHARTCRRARPPDRLYPNRGLWRRHGRHDRNLRRHLGAVAIMGFVMSDGMENPKTKGQTYKLSREIAKRFGEKNTTTVCGTLKGIGSDKGPLRSCPGCIDDAVEIACDVLKQLAE